MKKGVIGFLPDHPDEEPTNNDSPEIIIAIEHVVNNYISVATLPESDFISNDRLMEEVTELLGKKVNRVDFIRAMELEEYQHCLVDGKGIVWLLRSK
jgi:hypothetical protein